MGSTSWRPPILRRTTACGLWHGGSPAPYGRPRWPCGPETRGGACGQASTVDRCASQLFSRLPSHIGRWPHRAIPAAPLTPDLQRERRLIGSTRALVNACNYRPRRHLSSPIRRTPPDCAHLAQNRYQEFEGILIRVMNVPLGARVSRSAASRHDERTRLSSAAPLACGPTGSPATPLHRHGQCRQSPPGFSSPTARWLRTSTCG